jgi:cobalamin biosynthesis protein CobT
MKSRYHSPDAERSETAVRALAEMRRSLRNLTYFARAITGDDEVRVEVGKATCTDGKTILVRPPMELGRVHHHDRLVCGQRDEYLKQKCPACASIDSVYSSIFHEIAHIVFDSFQSVSDTDRAELVARAVNERPALAGTRYDKLRKAIERLGYRYNTSYVDVCGVVSPYMHPIVNSLEDARVNRAMYSARQGTYEMFRAQATQAFRTGIELPDGTFAEWRDRPLDSQIIIGLYCKASRFDYDAWFQPEAVEVLADQQLTGMIRSLDHVRSIGGVYRAAFAILERIRELGYCKAPDDAEDDPPPPPPLPPVPAPPTPPEEVDEDDEDQDDDENQDEESQAGDGEPGESDEGDAEDDEQESDDDGEGSADLDDEVDEQESDEEGDGDEPDGTEPDDGEFDDNEDEGTGGPSRLDDEFEDEDEDWDDEEGDSDDDPMMMPDDEFDPNEGDDESDDDEVDTDDEPQGNDPTGEFDDDDESEEDDESDGGSDDDEGDDDTSEPGSDGDGADGESDGADDESDPDEGDDEPELTGDPEVALDDLQEFNGHTPGTPSYDPGEAADQEAIERAIVQGEHFDAPSRTVRQVLVNKYDPADPKGAWADEDRNYARVEVDTILAPPGVIAGSTQALRAVFANNKKARRELGHRSGRISAQLLPQVATGNTKVFTRKQLPGKRDYFVCITLDISGSTSEGTRLQTIRQMGVALGDLLTAVGVEFAMYAHTGDYPDRDTERRRIIAKDNSGQQQNVLDLDIYELKARREPWSMVCKERIAKLTPFMVNLDGHTLEFMRKRCDESSATNKILLYVTDGDMPATNYNDELDLLRHEIQVCKQRGYELIGVGILNDEPTKHGLDTVRVDSVNDIPRLIAELRRRLSRTVA